MKFSLFLLTNRLGNSHEIQMDAENILCNNIVFSHETNPHGVRLWAIGNEFGALCAVWADSEADALDTAFDANFLESLLISQDDFAGMSEDEQEDCARLGNASEPGDLTNVWIHAVRLHVAHDFSLLMAFAEARGECAGNASASATLANAR